MIGVYINNHGITSHGFALNVTTDLPCFWGIVPCGIQNHGVMSMEKVLERPLLVTDVIPHITAAFRRVFKTETETSLAF